MKLAHHFDPRLDTTIGAATINKMIASLKNGTRGLPLPRWTPPSLHLPRQTPIEPGPADLNHLLLALPAPAAAVRAADAHEVVVAVELTGEADGGDLGEAVGAP